MVDCGGGFFMRIFAIVVARYGKDTTLITGVGLVQLAVIHVSLVIALLVLRVLILIDHITQVIEERGALDDRVAAADRSALAHLRRHDARHRVLGNVIVETARAANHVKRHRARRLDATRLAAMHVLEAVRICLQTSRWRGDRQRCPEAIFHAWWRWCRGTHLIRAHVRLLVGLRGMTPYLCYFIRLPCGSAMGSANAIRMPAR